MWKPPIWVADPKAAPPGGSCSPPIQSTTAITLNTTRRQLGPAAQGKALKELGEAVAEAHNEKWDRPGGTSPSQGQKPLKGLTAGAKEVARRVGMPERTVRNRMELATELEDHPEVAARVDAKEINQKQARVEVGGTPTARDRGAQAIKPKTPKNANHKPPGTANAVQARVASTATQPRLPDMLRIVHQR